MEKPDIFLIESVSEIVSQLCTYIGSSYRQIATNAGIHPSYFSRVMTGKAHFSQDQLFTIARLLKIGASEIEYLLLLGSWEASAEREHKEFLKQRLLTFRKKAGKATEKLKQLGTEVVEVSSDLASYYDEPLTAKIHMALTIDKLRKNLPAIATLFGIADETLHEHIIKLNALGLVSFEGTERIKVLQSSVHLDESNPLSRRNHLNWRHEIISKLWNRGISASDYHASVTFTANEATKKRAKAILKDALVAIGSEVDRSRTEENVYILGIDLY